MIARLLACLSLVVPTLPAAVRAADPTPAPADEAGEVGEVGEQPPPGTPADVKLWRQGSEVSEQIAVEIKQANRLQWQARQLKYDDRLDALSKGPDAPKAKQAASLLGRFRPALALNMNTYSRQWPVDPTRGCRYGVLHLEGVMRTEEHPRKKTQLAVVREELQDCVDKADKAVKVMATSNQEMRKLFAEADALLPPIVFALPPGVTAPPVLQSTGPTPHPAQPAPAKN